MKMIPSIQAINLIKQSESLRLQAYPDPATGNLPITIGWGSTHDLNGNSFFIGQTITEAMAGAFLISDVTKLWSKAETMIKVSLNQNQVDALTDFIYNVGIYNFETSTMLKLINQSKFDEASNEFLKWNHANGKVLPGLTHRRGLEKALFLKV